MVQKFLRVSMCVSLFVSTFIPIPKVQAALLNLPQPGAMLSLSSAYAPVLLKGLKVHPDNPVLFDFIIASAPIFACAFFIFFISKLLSNPIQLNNLDSIHSKKLPMYISWKIFSKRHLDQSSYLIESFGLSLKKIKPENKQNL